MMVISDSENSPEIDSAALAFVFIILVYYPQIEQRINNIYVLNTSIDQLNINELSQDEELNREEQKIINNAKNKEQIYEVVDVIKENSSKGDSIYSHKLAGNLYLLSDRVSSIKFFNLPAVNINENPIIGEDFLSEITNNHTELIIIGSNFNSANRLGIEKEFFDYVTSNYNLIYEEDFIINLVT